MDVSPFEASLLLRLSGSVGCTMIIFYLQQYPLIGEHIWCLSVWVWITPHRMILPRFIHLSANFIVFNSWVIFYCLDEPHFLYPFFMWQFLAIINRAAKNTVESILVVGWYIPSSGLEVGQLPVFWEIAILISIVIVWVYTLPAM